MNNSKPNHSSAHDSDSEPASPIIVQERNEPVTLLPPIQAILDQLVTEIERLETPAREAVLNRVLAELARMG